MTSINLADELVTLLMSILLTQSQWEKTDKMRMQTLRGQGFAAEPIIRLYKNEINGGHFEHLM